ncbi:hypothetical protein BU25DRAFT_195561 [Macroventuria anomochaeta]|uniref:Uncharacterized protein n=1 Tax=Macroventuria anomochaeta TaxID=301207 RepID=A0ACB6SCL1_9PLEO|nr:uncharacterized protein BU25DRAFT_195561 [Macroventuria anomochaeta]KAF2631727.1 hypothetical protein BU25DRAFT_195561 [Macroventuria anomochaeta]
MRLPQRFERVPHQEPGEDQDIVLPAYPSQTKLDIKSDMKTYQSDRFEPIRTDTEYTAGAYMTEEYTITHRKTWVERLEEYEHRHFGTHILSFFYENLISGWRAGLLRAFTVSVLALIVNISIFAWLSSRFNLESGTGLIHTGKCNEVGNMETGIKVGLNVLSTLILGASTYAMQGTTAPTREEVDNAHAKGKWLEIGTQSWRNLGYVSKKHATIWSVLALTSLPLHLVFNAVFFTTTETYQYAVAVVDRGFLNNTVFQATSENSSPALPQFKQFEWSGKCDGEGQDSCIWDIKNDTMVLQLLDGARDPSQAQAYKRLDPLECMESYTEGFMQKFSDVVVVSNTTQTESPILWTRYPQRVLTMDKRDTNNDPFHWICQDTLKSDNESGICYKEKALKAINPNNWTVYGHSVDYCIARKAPELCYLQYNVWIMGAVIVFSVFKVSAIAFLVFTHPKEKFLRTIGDAIASFLERQDSTTKDMCLVSSAQIRRHGFKTSALPQTSTNTRRRWWSRATKQEVTLPYAPQTFTNARPRRWTGANTTEFFSTVGISAAYVIILTVTLGWATSETNGNAFDSDFGRPNIQSLAKLKPDDVGSSGIVPTLLTANIPQLGFSLLYVFYTNIWSKLLIAHEFDRLTTSKKGLRVSERPRGHQRTSHFFTLPTRYAFPLMACSAALHWLCSRSLFMARFDGIDAYGKVDPNDQIVRLAYNVTGMAALIAVNFGMMVATVCIAGFQRQRTGLGEIAMSVVISAACHVERHEAEPWLQKVQWGDVSGDIKENEKSDAIRHCAFTSLRADPPIVGQKYQ